MNNSGCHRYWWRRFRRLLRAGGFGATRGLMFVNVTRVSVPCGETDCDDLGLLRVIIETDTDERVEFFCPWHAETKMSLYEMWHGYTVKCGSDARIMIALARRQRD